MTDREEARLREAVRVCNLESTVIHPERRWVTHRADTFSPEGNLLEHYQRNPEGSPYSIVYRYDEAGRIQEKERLPQEQTFLYMYDVVGRPGSGPDSFQRR